MVNHVAHSPFVLIDTSRNLKSRDVEKKGREVVLQAQVEYPRIRSQVF